MTTDKAHPGVDGRCINWTGQKDNLGYGKIRLSGRDFRAHRVAWIMHHGLIPHGLVIDHLCRNTSCVNVDHMEVVTVEYMRRQYAKGKR